MRYNRWKGVVRYTHDIKFGILQVRENPEDLRTLEGELTVIRGLLSWIEHEINAAVCAGVPKPFPPNSKNSSDVHPGCETRVCSCANM